MLEHEQKAARAARELVDQRIVGLDHAREVIAQMGDEELALRIDVVRQHMVLAYAALNEASYQISLAQASPALTVHRETEEDYVPF